MRACQKSHTGRQSRHKIGTAGAAAAQSVGFDSQSANQHPALRTALALCSPLRRCAGWPMVGPACLMFCFCCCRLHSSLLPSISCASSTEAQPLPPLATLPLPSLPTRPPVITNAGASRDLWARTARHLAAAPSHADCHSVYQHDRHSSSLCLDRYRRLDTVACIRHPPALHLRQRLHANTSSAPSRLTLRLRPHPLRTLRTVH